jgi:hypothetical protein
MGGARTEPRACAGSRLRFTERAPWAQSADDTELIEVALANLAVADQYPDWLLSQRGTVAKEIDLDG